MSRSEINICMWKIVLTNNKISFKYTLFLLFNIEIKIVGMEQITMGGYKTGVEISLGVCQKSYCSVKKYYNIVWGFWDMKNINLRLRKKWRKFSIFLKHSWLILRRWRKTIISRMKKRHPHRFPTLYKLPQRSHPISLCFILSWEIQNGILVLSHTFNTSLFYQVLWEVTLKLWWEWLWSVSTLV